MYLPKSSLDLLVRQQLLLVFTFRAPDTNWHRGLPLMFAYLTTYFDGNTTTSVRFQENDTPTTKAPDNLFRINPMGKISTLRTPAA